MGKRFKLTIAEGTPVSPLSVVEQEKGPPGWTQMWGHAAAPLDPPIPSLIEKGWSWTGKTVIILWALSFQFQSNQCPEIVVPNPFDIISIYSYGI